MSGPACTAFFKTFFHKEGCPSKINEKVLVKRWAKGQGSTPLEPLVGAMEADPAMSAVDFAALLRLAHNNDRDVGVGVCGPSLWPFQLWLARCFCRLLFWG